MSYQIIDNQLEVKITLLSGDIAFVSEDREDFEIDFEDLRKGTSEEIFDIKYEDNLLTLKEKKHNKVNKFFSSEEMPNNNVIIKIPENLNISGEIKTYSGNITADKLNFDGKIKSYNGDITIKDHIKGDITIKSYSGDFNCNYFEGNFNSSFLSGDIKISNALFNKFNTKVHSGDLRVSGIFDLKEAANIKSLSGDIYLNIKEFIGEEEINIKALSGDVKIEGDYPKEQVKIKKLSSIPNMIDIPNIPDLKKVFKIFKKGKNEKIEVNVDDDNQNVEKVLNMLSDGKINTDEAERLIQSLKS